LESLRQQLVRAQPVERVVGERIDDDLVDPVGTGESDECGLDLLGVPATSC
jgi:hypothetical protein